MWKGRRRVYIDIYGEIDDHKQNNNFSNKLVSILINRNYVHVIWYTKHELNGYIWCKLTFCIMVNDKVA